MNQITIVDSILSELATVTIRADHLAVLINEKKVRRNEDHRLEMKHTDFIAYLNEQAL